MEINRDVYLERLIVRKHNGFIKVITGDTKMWKIVSVKYIVL